MNKNRIAIILILILALTLRISFFRTNETIISSDEIFLFQNSLKPLTFLLGYDINHYAAELFRFSNFNWGLGTLSFSTIFTLFLYIFKIPITEFTINLPYIFVGTLTVYLFYLFGKELGDERVGLFASLLLAIHPVHVSTSRSIGLIGIVATFFFTLTLYYFVRYFKYKTNKNLAFLSLGFYIASDFQFYGIFPLIIVLGVLLKKKKGLLDNIFSVAKDLFVSKSVLFFLMLVLPILLSAIYLYTQNFLHNAYLLHIFQKSNHLGIFFFRTINEFYGNVGPALLVLFLTGLFYFIFKLFLNRKINKMTYFVLLWLCIQLIPWVFLVNRQDTLVIEYIYHANSAFIFLSAFFLRDLWNYFKKKTLFVILFVFLIITPTLLATSVVTYNRIPFIDVELNENTPKNLTDNWYDTQVFGLNLHFGRVGRNTGIKTASYYLRGNSPNDSVIFSDHESFVAEYYTGRKIAGDLDSFSENEIINSYLHWKQNNSIDYIYLENKKYDVLKKIIVQDEFIPLLEVIFKNNTLGILYGKKTGKTPTDFVRLDASKTDKLFDKKYGNIKSLFVDYD